MRKTMKRIFTGIMCTEMTLRNILNKQLLIIAADKWLEYLIHRVNLGSLLVSYWSACVCLTCPRSSFWLSHTFTSFIDISALTSFLWPLFFSCTCALCHSFLHPVWTAICLCGNNVKDKKPWALFVSWNHIQCEPVSICSIQIYFIEGA